MTKKETKRGEIWLAVFLVIPGVIVAKLGEEYSGWEGILSSALFGGLGALIGMGLYQLVILRSDTVKALSALFLIGASVLVLVVGTRFTHPVLSTCEICGYQAIEAERKECGYCGSLTWEEERKAGDYADKSEWLRDEQLYWFSLDSQTQAIDFYQPAQDEGFRKDRNWKPAITEKDLREDFE